KCTSYFMSLTSAINKSLSSAVVANRLSEIENWKILLLEAGGDETDISDVPVLAAYLQLSGLDWSYKTEPSSTSCLGTVRNGARCSTSKAFLQPVKTRPNLHISLHSHVTKVLIDPKNRMAIGVEFVKNHQRHVIRARKEVILSGDRKTKLLLMLSGIGPADHLQELRIPVIQNLPVGYNLQDHIAMGGATYLIESPPECLPLGAGIVLPRIFTIDSLMRFLRNHDGPLYGLPFCEGMAFVNT
ncbi:glucose dehydrogenase [FAD, quinone]-like, partial [Diaphorina citri]|uniref:Glucose dehydrogenase [FAD, quinone]-like n=1 Tax=Diaphorina citri TaxID=121845 RepID=A0A1S4ENT2_DIACI